MRYLAFYARSAADQGGIHRASLKDEALEKEDDNDQSIILEGTRKQHGRQFKKHLCLEIVDAFEPWKTRRNVA